MNGGQDSRSGPMWSKMRQYRGMGTGEDKGNLSGETTLGEKKQNFPSVVMNFFSGISSTSPDPSSDKYYITSDECV